MNNILLADIGNTHFHIYDGTKVEHLSYDDAIGKYHHQKLLYITVKHQLSTKIEKIKLWENISSRIEIGGQYNTMGVDRRALCLSQKNGVFVDAGSAITVDVVVEGIYKGGYIFPGVKAMLESYKRISPALDTTLNKNISLAALALTTEEQISYGIIASIKTLIEKHSHGKNLYFTGGDGKLLSSFFDTGIYDEMLVFQGMQNTLKIKAIKD